MTHDIFYILLHNGSVGNQGQFQTYGCPLARYVPCIVSCGHVGKFSFVVKMWSDKPKRLATGDSAFLNVSAPFQRITSSVTWFE